jgi:tRNA-dihydrouridine synthase B
MSPIEALRKNPFILAPMAGITDHAFRTYMRQMGSSVMVTELVSANGIQYESAKTLALMAYDEIQRPLGVQLFGEDPEIVAKAALYAQEKGADFVDLNFGCPVPKVVKKGAGSAILKDLPAVQKMFTSVKKAIDIPLTVKIRTGWDAQTRNAIDVCRLAYDEGLEWVAIHGRTRAQGYEGLADWDYIAEVKSKVSIPVIGNGDILNAQQAVKSLKESKVDGIMIGRGALKNPYIFKESLALLNGERTLSADEKCLTQAYQSLATCLAQRCEEHILQIQLRKFAAWFATGYPRASAFRKAVFQSTSSQETLALALGFFQTTRLEQQEAPSAEGFLMGGHG